MSRFHRRSHRRSRRSRRSPVENLFTGLGLIALGTAFWGERQGWFGFEEIFLYWPVLLLWAGLGKLLAGRFVEAIGLVTFGGLAQLHTLDILDLSASWPLGLVAVGVAISVGALVDRNDGPRTRDDCDGDAGESSDPTSSDAPTATAEPPGGPLLRRAELADA